jgi:hypothetical protein
MKELDATRWGQVAGERVEMPGTVSESRANRRSAAELVTSRGPTEAELRRGGAPLPIETEDDLCGDPGSVHARSRRYRR